VTWSSAQWQSNTVERAAVLFLQVQVFSVNQALAVELFGVAAWPFAGRSCVKIRSKDVDGCIML
jgi:hypothetical protein